MISDPYLLMARFIVVPMKMARTRVQYRIAASSFLDIVRLLQLAIHVALSFFAQLGAIKCSAENREVESAQCTDFST